MKTKTRIAVVGAALWASAAFWSGAAMAETLVAPVVPNRDVVNVEAFGATREATKVDNGAVAKAKAVSDKKRVPLVNYHNVDYANLGAKIWRPTFGTKDTAATFSVTTAGKAEEATQVLGFTADSDASVYPDRDSVSVFAQNVSQAPVFASSSTTFTATTVTAPGLAAVAASIKEGMLVDVAGAPKWTGTVTGINGDTLTVSAWYVVDKSRTASTPPSGAAIKVNPTTKIWAMNANVTLMPDGDANAATGFELGLLPVKPGTGGSVWGFDAVGFGPEPAYAGHIARGSLTRGFSAEGDTKMLWGYYAAKAVDVSYGAYNDFNQQGQRINFYSEKGKWGFRSLSDLTAFYANAPDIGISIQDPQVKALTIAKAGVEKFGIDQDGQITNVHMKAVLLYGSAVYPDDVAYVLLSASNAVLTLPNPTSDPGRVVAVRSFGENTIKTAVGTIDGASDSKGMPAGFMGRFIAVGNAWYQVP